LALTLVSSSIPSSRKILMVASGLRAGGIPQTNVVLRLPIIIEL
jgi:hypothetical protein